MSNNRSIYQKLKDNRVQIREFPIEKVYNHLWNGKYMFKKQMPIIMTCLGIAISTAKETRPWS